MSIISRIFRRKQRYVGSQVVLRPLYKKDLPTILKWFSDIDLLELGFGTWRTTPNFDHVASSYLKNLTAHRECFLAIDVPAAGFIGFISFHVIDSIERLARVGILIGEKSAWGKGYGKDAVRTALWYLFMERGLNQVELDTAEFNVRAQRCFEACGFKVDPERTRQLGEAQSPKRIWYTITRGAFLRQEIPSGKSIPRDK